MQEQYAAGREPCGMCEKAAVQASGQGRGQRGEFAQSREKRLHGMHVHFFSALRPWRLCKKRVSGKQMREQARSEGVSAREYGMRRTGIFFLMVALVCGSLPACTNIKDDETRTKTEGTLTGAGVGAVVGAIIGAVLDGGRGAARGAAIGAGAGGVAGYAYGSHVANQKANYASREEWLDACLVQTEQAHRTTAEYNARLRGDLARLDKETRALETAYKQGKVQRSSLRAEEKLIRQRIAETEQLIQRAEAEIGLQNSVVQEARAGGNDDKAARLEAEVRGLREQVDQLKDQSAQLAAMSHRMDA
jgi:hypothetical protein